MVTHSPDLLGKGVFTFGYIWACLFPGSDTDSTVPELRSATWSSQSLGSYFWQLSVRNQERRDDRESGTISEETAADDAAAISAVGGDFGAAAGGRRFPGVLKISL